MKSHLIQIEQEALRLRNLGQLKEAVELFTAIVKEQPDWEHGTAFYDLACCYEDLGQLSLAEQCYREALHYEPRNTNFLGGFTSFLYLHGDPEVAFSAHLDLLEIQKTSKDYLGMESTEKAIVALGKRLGFPEEHIAAKVNAIKGRESS